MGYESRLYIVEKSSLNKDPDIGLRFAGIVSVFNLSKVGKVSDQFLNYPDTDCFIYADDGNTRITEDRYGDALKEIPIKDAIEILKNAAKEDNWYYRRFKPVVALLEGFELDKWKDLAILHYGY